MKKNKRVPTPVVGVFPLAISCKHQPLVVGVHKQTQQGIVTKPLQKSAFMTAFFALLILSISALALAKSGI